MHFVCLLAFFKIGSRLYPLSLSPTSTTAGSQDLCTKKKARFPDVGEGKALPSYCSHPGRYHVTSMLPAGSRKSIFLYPGLLCRHRAALPPMAVPPCPVQHQGPAGALTGMTQGCCSTAYQHTTQCQVPLLDTAAVHRKLRTFTANSLCALVKMTHSFSDQA